MSLKKILLILTALAWAGCASAPGGGSSGGAGTSTMINGVEVWRDGVPSRPYRVIAQVSKQGADQSSDYRQEEGLITIEAQQRGADAVIVLNAVMTVGRMDPINGRPLMAPKVTAELIKYE